VAGFNQLFRSLIPESVVGANAGARFETYGVSLEQTLRPGTYLGMAGEMLNSDVRRSVGLFRLDTDVQDEAWVSSTRELLDYSEKTLRFTVDQLLGGGVSLGAGYRISLAELEGRHPEFLDPGIFLNDFTPWRDEESLMHQVNLRAQFNHSSGFFALTQGLWTHQSNRGYSGARPGDDFWQMNLFGGWR